MREGGVMTEVSSAVGPAGDGGQAVRYDGAFDRLPPQRSEE